MSPKNAITIRIDSEIESEIQSFADYFEERTGIPITKTAIIESALREGLKVLKNRLDKGNQEGDNSSAMEEIYRKAYAKEYKISIAETNDKGVAHDRAHEVAKEARNIFRQGENIDSFLDEEEE